MTLPYITVTPHPRGAACTGEGRLPETADPPARLPETAP
jgi:hypothetical protein